MGKRSQVLKNRAFGLAFALTEVDRYLLGGGPVSCAVVSAAVL